MTTDRMIRAALAMAASFGILLALFGAVGTLAQTVNICDRTPQVRVAIMAVIDANNCDAITAAQLAAVNGLLCLRYDGGWNESCLPSKRDNSIYHRRPPGALKSTDFDGLTGLEGLVISTRPESGFSFPDQSPLTTLPDGIFDGLTSLRTLSLQDNKLTLQAGLFDRLTRLRTLSLVRNQLTTLPAGIFDSLTSLQYLNLQENHLVGLTRNDPLFARLPSGVQVELDRQTQAPEQPEEPEANAQRLAAAAPLMVSASDSMRQGFVRIINESGESGSVRILAFDDAGTEAEPIEIQLGANQSLHFNSNDLEGGNAAKGINAGIGSPMRGDWRLDVETALNVRVLSFVRTTDGFLTAMGEVLPRGADGRLAAHVFNPGSNMNQESRLRLVNTRANAERVSIEGVDDQGGRGGPVTLTLAAGESRTLSAFDLENGAQGLTGTLGDGAGKWRLFITAGQAVEGMSLLEAVSGHLTNISAMGVATE